MFPNEKARPLSEICSLSLKRVSVCGPRKMSVIDLRVGVIRGLTTDSLRAPTTDFRSDYSQASNRCKTPSNWILWWQDKTKCQLNYMPLQHSRNKAFKCLNKWATLQRPWVRSGCWGPWCHHGTLVRLTETNRNFMMTGQCNSFNNNQVNVIMAFDVGKVHKYFKCCVSKWESTSIEWDLYSVIETGIRVWTT